MMTPDEMIAVIQAHKEGKEIEVRSVYEAPSGCWLPADPSWNFFKADYRIKPDPKKPREWWIVEGAGPFVIGCSTIEETQARYVSKENPYPTIHVCEVLPEE